MSTEEMYAKLPLTFCNLVQYHADVLDGVISDTQFPSQPALSYVAEMQLFGDTHMAKSATKERTENPQLLIPGKYRWEELPDVPLPFIMQCLKNNEYGDAQLFARIFEGKCVKDHTENAWYLWQGHYWRKDKTRHVLHMVGNILASVYLRASSELAKRFAWQSDQKGDVEIDIMEPMTEEEEKEKSRKERVAKLADRGKSLMNESRMLHILTLAESFLGITGDMWDRDPWSLGTEQGVIELRKGILRPGKPSEYIRIVCPTPWTGFDTPCPRFVQFLQEVFSDRSDAERDELIAFFQRVLGYGITGIVRDQIFLFLYGEEGRNGKDTLMNALLAVLGAHVQKVPKDVFLASPKNMSSNGAPSPHLITLQGKRIAYAEEPDRGERFGIGQIKDLTGQSPITARAPYDKDYRTFDPSHLLLLLTNNKPHADASDAAFWDRVCPIVYNLRFVDTPIKPNERKKDTSLSIALESEASGILAWLVRGCLAWQSHGLDIPASVIAERKKYRREEDTLGTFLRETCKAGEGFEVKCGALYDVYKGWALTNSIKPMTGTSFGKEIQKLYPRTPKPRSTGYYYLGIRLLGEDELPDEDEPEAPEKPVDAPTEEPHDMAALSLQWAKDALSALPESTVTLEIGDGKNKPKEQLNPEKTLRYLTRLMGMDKDLGVRVISANLPRWKAAAAQQKG